MILCTGCGTRNADDAHTCQTCGRKLQSRWSQTSAPADQPASGSTGAKAGDDLSAGVFGGGQNDPGGDAGPWRELAPVERAMDPSASRLMRNCAETWMYALLLVAGALTTGISEDWRYLAGTLVAAALLAWARGI